MRKETILDNQHWDYEECKQRINVKDWKQILLNNDDNLIFLGEVTRLIGRNIGFGLLEVSKAI